MPASNNHTRPLDFTDRTGANDEHSFVTPAAFAVDPVTRGTNVAGVYAVGDTDFSVVRTPMAVACSAAAAVNHALCAENAVQGSPRGSPAVGA